MVGEEAGGLEDVLRFKRGWWSPPLTSASEAQCESMQEAGTLKRAKTQKRVSAPEAWDAEHDMGTKPCTSTDETPRPQHLDLQM